MTDFNQNKIHTVYKDSVEVHKFSLPRRYTLTHSDSTGDLFLTISQEYDQKQISGLYTRFMRDEVLAEWQQKDQYFELHLFVHVSGGFLFGWAGLRDKIFRQHLPLVFQTIVYGDKRLFEEFPELNDSQILVHFQSKNKKYNKTENFGKIKDVHH